MLTKIDTVVVGAGAMGLATTWQLARRGREVTLIEQFAPGHHNGASHGATRNFNTGYAEPTYADLVWEANPVAGAGGPRPGPSSSTSSVSSTTRSTRDSTTSTAP